VELGQTCRTCKRQVTDEHAVEVVYPWGTEIEYADPCLGCLPGVAFACCGHGDREMYIAFENGVTIRSRPKTVERHEGWTPGHRYANTTDVTSFPRELTYDD